MTANNISRTGELITVKSSLFSPTGIFVMSNNVIKNPAIIMGLIALIFSLVAHPVILTILGETISIFDYIKGHE